MAYTDPSIFLQYNYADATNNGNWVSWIYDNNNGREANYKANLVLAENTDGTLTLWQWHNDYQDTRFYSEATALAFYALTPGGSLDKSVDAGHQQLLFFSNLSRPPTSGYEMHQTNADGSVPNLPWSGTNNVVVNCVHDTVNVPNPQFGVPFPVFRCRLQPTGGVGTVLHLANASHWYNGIQSEGNHGYNDGNNNGAFNLTLQGQRTIVYPTLIAATPADADRDASVVLSGTNLSGDYTAYFNDLAHPAPRTGMTSSSLTLLVPPTVPVGAATIFLSNGSYQSNSLTFQVTGKTLFSAYSNEAAVLFPAPVTTPPPVVLTGISLQPAQATVPEGQSVQFRCIGLFSNGSSTTLAANVSWSLQNIDGAGSIGPDSGLFIAQQAGSQVIVTASVPIGDPFGYLAGAPDLADTQGTLTATAAVIVAARPIAPLSLQSLQIVPVDPTLLTGSTTQFLATGINSVGNTVFPRVVWSVLNGMQRPEQALLDSSTFDSGGSIGSLFGASPQIVTSGVHSGTLTPLIGQALRSLQSSYLASDEWYWMEWEILNTAAGGGTPGYGPAIYTADGKVLYANLTAGTINLLPAAGGTATVLGSFSAPSASTATMHVVLLGFELVGTTQLHIKLVMDETVLYDQTVSATWTDLAHPGLWFDNGSTIFVQGQRAFASALASIDGVASVDQFGLLTTAQAGQVTVLATAQDASGLQASSVVTVTDPVVIAQPPILSTFHVTPKSAVCQAGSTVQFRATAVDQYNNPYPVPVVWSVTNTVGAGQVDPQSGLFSGQVAGSNIVVTATSTDGSRLTDSASVVVTAGALTKITVTPSSTLLEVGQGQQFTATGYDRFDNAIVLTGVSWAMAGGTGTVDNTGLFMATTAGVGKVIASQGVLQGSATTNVLAVVGELIILTTPQQPFARVNVKDAVSDPLIIDTRVRGGGLIDATRLDLTDQFWWDLTSYDGIPFQAFGVYAAFASFLSPLSADESATRMQSALDKYAAPQFLGVIAPGSRLPVTTF